MPRLLAIGHVTRDRIQGREALGGSVTYAALTARQLGWDAAVLTAAGEDFDAAAELPGVEVVVQPSARTTRFHNDYDREGRRTQTVTAAADPIDLSRLPESWREPDALLLGPVVGELGSGTARALEAELVGALGQGWLREIGAGGQVNPREWRDPAADLAGVHVLFLAEHDLPTEGYRLGDYLGFVPILVVTRGWEGLDLVTRQSSHRVPGLPRAEVDPTGAGDVLAAAFLVAYHETGDPLEAAAFATCAASCAVEGLGASRLGSRAEVERRMAQRERLIEEGEWEE